MVRRRGKQQNSNLFAIDFEAIEAVLEDANRPLIAKAEDILNQAGNFSEDINDNTEADTLAKFLRDLRSQQKELSRARLSDGRPFTDAAGVVKEWFGKVEDRLKAADSRLAEKLSVYTASVAAKADAVRRRNEELERLANQQTEQKIGEAVTGEPIVTVKVSPSEPVQERELEPDVPEVQMVWQAKAFDLETVDIEKLRHYFTDYAIRLAINSHIKENGPHQIGGVVYEQVVAKKL